MKVYKDAFIAWLDEKLLQYNTNPFMYDLYFEIKTKLITVIRDEHAKIQEGKQE